MKYNQLGRTGLFVSEICLGTMTFGGSENAGRWTAIGALQQDEVNGIVGRALSDCRVVPSREDAGRAGAPPEDRGLDSD